LAVLEGYPEITELFAERLKARHRERRAPYIKALAQLHRAKNER
jgi:hypothetical protein